MYLVANSNDWEEIPTQSKNDQWEEVPTSPLDQVKARFAKAQQSSPINIRLPDNNSNPLGSSPSDSPALQEAKDRFEYAQQDPTMKKITTGITSGGVGQVIAPFGKAMSELAGKGASKLSDFLAPAAERSEVLSQVKNEAGLGPYVSNKIQEAGQNFDESQIAPKMAQQYKNASGKFVDLNPKDYTGIHPEIDQAMSKYPVNESGKISIPMEDALDLRAELNSKTRFKQGGVYQTADQVRSAQSAAADAGNNLRQSLSEVDPEIGQSSDELRQAYNLKKGAIGKGANSPISTVIAPQASDKASTLAQFDQSAGSNLRGLGNNIQTAKSRLQVYTPTGLKKLLTIGAPKEAFELATEPIARAYDAGAQVAKPAIDAAGRAIQTPIGQAATTGALQTLFQRKNR